jgi:hypothetical protein
MSKCTAVYVQWQLLMAAAAVLFGIRFELATTTLAAGGVLGGRILM